MRTPRPRDANRHAMPRSHSVADSPAATAGDELSIVSHSEYTWLLHSVQCTHQCSDARHCKLDCRRESRHGSRDPRHACMHMPCGHALATGACIARAAAAALWWIRRRVDKTGETHHDSTRSGVSSRRGRPRARCALQTRVRAPPPAACSACAGRHRESRRRRPAHTGHRG